MVDLDSGCKRLQKLFRDSGARQADDRKFWFSVVLTDEKNGRRFSLSRSLLGSPCATTGLGCL